MSQSSLDGLKRRKKCNRKLSSIIQQGYNTHHGSKQLSSSFMRNYAVNLQTMKQIPGPVLILWNGPFPPTMTEKPEISTIGVRKLVRDLIQIGGSCVKRVRLMSVRPN